jgi:hypothetical protein
MAVVPMLISLMFLIPVLVGCLLVDRCRTLFALRVLQIGLVVGYMALTVLALWIPMTHGWR